MRDIILLVATFLVIIISFALVMNYKVTQKPLLLDDDLEATLVVIDDGYAGDIIIK